MSSLKQIERISDDLNVALDQIRAEQESARESARSVIEIQQYAVLYERIKSAQDDIDKAARAFSSRRAE